VAWFVALIVTWNVRISPHPKIFEHYPVKIKRGK
jgi:hypothetical protein